MYPSLGQHGTLPTLRYLADAGSTDRSRGLIGAAGGLSMPTREQSRRRQTVTWAPPSTGSTTPLM